MQQTTTIHQKYTVAQYVSSVIQSIYSCFTTPWACVHMPYTVHRMLTHN